MPDDKGQTMAEALEELRDAGIQLREAIVEALPGFRAMSKAIEKLRRKAKDRWDSGRTK